MLKGQVRSELNGGTRGAIKLYLRIQDKLLSKAMWMSSALRYGLEGTSWYAAPSSSEGGEPWFGAMEWDFVYV